MTVKPAESVPNSTKILVIGGGPAGAYSSTLLAREGFEVTLLERDSFPRYHIGESLLPSIRQFLQLIDAESIMEARGFTPKPGAAVKLNQYSREGYTDFVAVDPTNKAWNVVRSEFDEVLLRHASASGVRVHERTKVVSISLKGERPVSAQWESQAGITGTIDFEWLVDASGQSGIMSTQYLKNRSFSQSLKNIACWAYWTGGAVYALGTSRENAPWFEALTDESGWSWYIPLHNGSVSVGFVMNKDASVRKKSALGQAGSLTEHYKDQFQYTPGLKKLLENASLNSSVKSASDYSYTASTFSGDHFRLAGDAGAFIDPFFSSGVHLAFTGALSAACSIAASIRNHCSESNAQQFHNLKVGTAYTRFLIVVLSAYKQVQKQHMPVLQDVDEGNFDRAFSLLRPILQGSGDIGKELTEDEVQLAIDFCSHIFSPSDPKMHDEVAKRVGSELVDAEGPILSQVDIRDRVGEDEEAVHVLNRVNARKPIYTMYDVHSQFGREVWAGLLPICTRGELGLSRQV